MKRLFESEVAEVKDGTVEIKSIAREAGSRTKIAVWSNDPDVDAVGACVGMNGARVNAVVEELRGEKIDIINWDENPAILIENALSPAKVIAVMADPDEKTALVVVPDYQLSQSVKKVRMHVLLQDLQDLRLTSRVRLRQKKPVISMIMMMTRLQKMQLRHQQRKLQQKIP